MKSKAIFGLFALVSVSLVALSAQSAYAWTVDPNDSPRTNSKSYICKMVGTPGVNERLQTGNNPIQVDRKAEHIIGAMFVDAQGGSFVVGYGFPSENQNAQPQLSDCIGRVTPTPEVGLDVCTPGTISTDDVKVTVTNNDQVVGNTAVYTVKVGDQTKTSISLADGETQTLVFSGLAAGPHAVTISAYGQVVYTSSVIVGACHEEVDESEAVISASAICELQDSISKFVITLKNSGDLDGVAIVNGQTVEVAAGATKTVTIDAGLTLKVVFDGETILNETNKSLKCEGGSGGSNSTTPETPKTSETPESPIVLPFTSGVATPIVAVGALSLLGAVLAAGSAIKSRILA